MKNSGIIEKELKKSIGSDFVSMDLLERLCYSHDVTPICYKWIDLYGLPPYLCDIVAKPQNVSHIQKILYIANKYKCAIQVYGGGSGTVGGIIPTSGGISIDMSAMDKIIFLDIKSQLVEVEAGIIGQNLEDHLNEKGYSLRHFPQSMRSASIGGLIATKSIGQFSTKYGGIENYVTSIEAVLADGSLLKTLNKPRSSTGPEINNLFIGSEGIFGIITKATLKIYKLPEKMHFQCFLYSDIYEALDSIRQILQCGLKPAVVRLYNELESEQKFSKIGFKYKGCLLILCYEGNAHLVDAESEVSYENCIKNNAKDIGMQLGELWFKNRFDTKHILEKQEQKGGISDAIEIAATWDKINGLYDLIIRYFHEKNIEVASHFSHVYANGVSLYNIFFIDEKDEESAINRFYEIWKDILLITYENGGTISHHHGIGFIKKEMLQKELGRGHEILRDLKNVIDKNNILNKDKLIDG